MSKGESKKKSATYSISKLGSWPFSPDIFMNESLKKGSNYKPALMSPSILAPAEDNWSAYD